MRQVRSLLSQAIILEVQIVTYHSLMAPSIFNGVSQIFGIICPVGPYTNCQRSDLSSRVCRNLKNQKPLSHYIQCKYIAENINSEPNG